MKLPNINLQEIHKMLRPLKKVNIKELTSKLETMGNVAYSQDNQLADSLTWVILILT